MSIKPILFSAAVMTALAFVGCRWLEVNPEQYILQMRSRRLKTFKRCWCPADVMANLYDGDVQLE